MPEHDLREQKFDPNSPMELAKLTGEELLARVDSKELPDDILQQIAISLDTEFGSLSIEELFAKLRETESYKRAKSQEGIVNTGRLNWYLP